MQYLISFFEGILTFISPCLLPMLPVYISYFAGGEADSKKTFRNALGFILGFTILFLTKTLSEVLRQPLMQLQDLLKKIPCFSSFQGEALHSSKSRWLLLKS